MTLTRKQFVLGSIAGVVTACAGDDGGADGGTCEGVDATIASNHGHTLVIPLADVELGESRTYELGTGNGHTHTVTINGPKFEALAAGEAVEAITSTDGGHQHTVTVRCG